MKKVFFGLCCFLVVVPVFALGKKEAPAKSAVTPAKPAAGSAVSAAPVSAPAPAVAAAPPAKTYEDGFAAGYKKGHDAGREEGFNTAVETVEPLTEFITKKIGNNEDLKEVRVYLSKEVTLSATNVDLKLSKNSFTIVGRQSFCIKKGTRGRIVDAQLSKGLLKVAFNPGGEDFPLESLAFKTRQEGDVEQYYLLYRKDEKTLLNDTEYEVIYDGDAPFLLFQLVSSSDNISIPGVKPYEETGPTDQ
ncbi:MAG: hypothetical protein LBR23_01105 [Spirochaetaceae bacterium]|jgi:hypothetical protein|nr:hypothetical protein [Spirochaetaceae bacterium]